MDPSHVLYPEFAQNIPSAGQSIIILNTITQQMFFISPTLLW